MPDIGEAYVTITGESTIRARNDGDFTSKIVFGQEMRHWQLLKFPLSAVMKNDMDHEGLEPTYSEEVELLKEFGRWKEIALEIMPQESKLVDRINMYHLWEFQSPKMLAVNIQPIFNPPNCLDQLFEDICYKTVRQGETTYVYFHSGKELPWRKKQKLKNYIAGKEGTGIEIITTRMLGVGYGAMIILPYYLQLDFGLG